MKFPEVKSYREFLRTYGDGQSTDEIFSKKRASAETSYHKAKSTYGANAEALGEAGLEGSGYAAYLSDKAKGTHAQAMEEIALAKAEEENKRFTSYEKYLTNMRKQEDSLEGQIHRTVLSSRTTSIESALRVAEIYGLSGERARAAVESAVSLNIQRKKQEILDRIRTKRISPERAVLFGETYGLPADVVEEIRAFAEKLYGYNGLQAAYDNYTQAN